VQGGNQTVVKAKRRINYILILYFNLFKILAPPNVHEDVPRKEGVAAVKDYQTLGNLDPNIFLKEQNKKGATQKTVSKSSAISKDKTSTKKEKADDKTKAEKKDSNEDKKDKKDSNEDKKDKKVF
jgi:hypothetical protein